MNLIDKILFKYGYVKIVQDENPLIENDLILDECVDIKGEVSTSFHFSGNSPVYEAAHKLQLEISKEIYKEVIKNMELTTHFDPNGRSSESKVTANVWFKLYPMIPKDRRTCGGVKK